MEGTRLGKREVVEEHPRLLRSLHWGDDDYSGHVFTVLRKLAGDNFEHLATIAEFLELRTWLEKRDPKLLSELFDVPTPPGTVPLDQCEAIGSIHSVHELGRHAARIRSGLENGNDPELAIGSANELLESVLKTVTGDHGQKPTCELSARLRTEALP